MIKVYVWYGEYGHSALEIITKEHTVYISFHPSDAKSVPAVSELTVGKTPKYATYEEDLENIGRPPDVQPIELYTFEDESLINYYENILSDEKNKYQLFENNCSHMVMHILLIALFIDRRYRDIPENEEFWRIAKDIVDENKAYRESLQTAKIPFANRIWNTLKDIPDTLVGKSGKYDPAISKLPTPGNINKFKSTGTRTFFSITSSLLLTMLGLPDGIADSSIGAFSELHNHAIEFSERTISPRHVHELSLYLKDYDRCQCYFTKDIQPADDFVQGLYLLHSSTTLDQAKHLLMSSTLPPGVKEWFMVNLDYKVKESLELD